MDPLLCRAGLNLNLAGSFRSETDYVFRVFFSDLFFKTDFSYLFSYPFFIIYTSIKNITTTDNFLKWQAGWAGKIGL